MANEIDTKTENPEEVFFFAPWDEIRFIEKILFNLETTRRELQKVAEGMRPIKC